MCSMNQRSRITATLVQIHSKLDDPRPDKTAYWSQSDETADKADAYVIKVKFLDGTFWEDNGSYRCNAGIPILNIAKGGGLKAHEAAIKELEKKDIKGLDQDAPSAHRGGSKSPGPIARSPLGQVSPHERRIIENS